jgi:FKBP-type peptidyl-prolyl cis-trans isomerase SlpA
MSDLLVGESTRVTLNFSIKLEDGQLIDSTFDKSPAEFEIGDGNLLPGFERVLLGLSAGANEAFVIKPEEGFGQPNPSNIQEIPRDQFEDLELKEGLMIAFADAQNSETPGVVAAFNDEIVTIDFNHPLAGHDLLFEVEILDVQPAQIH